MLINYRTYTTIMATFAFNWLVKTGIIDLTNPYVTKETLEGIIITLFLIAIGVFRKYAGKKLY